MNKKIIINISNILLYLLSYVWLVASSQSLNSFQFHCSQYYLLITYNFHPFNYYLLLLLHLDHNFLFLLFLFIYLFNSYYYSVIIIHYIPLLLHQLFFFFINILHHQMEVCMIQIEVAQYEVLSHSLQTCDDLNYNKLIIN